MNHVPANYFAPVQIDSKIFVPLGRIMSVFLSSNGQVVKVKLLDDDGSSTYIIESDLPLNDVVGNWQTAYCKR